MSVKSKDDRFTDALGVELGYRWTAIEAVGLYVPGGTAAYPSSVLMNAIPAKVAGCSRIVMAVPTPGGEANPLVLQQPNLQAWMRSTVSAARRPCGLGLWNGHDIAVSKIVGPGNAYVAAAKRQVLAPSALI